MKFKNKHIEFMKKIGIRVRSYSNPSASDIALIESKVSEHLQKKGFDADYAPTEDGLLCEEILDIL